MTRTVVALIVLDDPETIGLELELDAWGQTRPLDPALADRVRAGLGPAPRVMAVMGEDEARLMLAAHCLALNELTRTLGEEIDKACPAGRH